MSSPVPPNGETEVKEIRSERNRLAEELQRLGRRAQGDLERANRAEAARDDWQQKAEDYAHELAEIEADSYGAVVALDKLQGRAVRAEAALREAREEFLRRADEAAAVIDMASPESEQRARHEEQALRAAVSFLDRRLDTSIGDREPEKQQQVESGKCERCGGSGEVVCRDHRCGTHAIGARVPCPDCKPPAPRSDPREQLDDVLLEQATAIALEDESEPSSSDQEGAGAGEKCRSREKVQEHHRSAGATKPGEDQ